MIKTFLRHKNHNVVKFGLPIAGLIAIIGSVFLLNSPFLFTYTSHANEDSANNISVEQRSVEPVKVHDGIPLCVSDFSYVPIAEKSLQSCFVQFDCIDPSNVNYFTSPHYSCSSEAQVFTCSENESKESCGFVDDWIKGAAITCGCEDEL